MPTILIVDPEKASLVMSSEVFKDKIPGAIVLVARTGLEALDVVSQKKPDMCVIDFDLPDTDGVTLIQLMRKYYNGPILLTAFPNPVVREAVAKELFAFDDAGEWVSKPVKFDVLAEKIDKFLRDKNRIGKRFELALNAEVIKKAVGRGKKPIKVLAKTINLSLGGACMWVEYPSKIRKNEELTLALVIREAKPPKTKAKTKTKSTAKVGASKGTAEYAKIKARVAWMNPKDKLTGLCFAALSDEQKASLEGLLRHPTAGPNQL